MNTIVPTAASRLTEDILPPEMFEAMKPELIAPVVVSLKFIDFEIHNIMCKEHVSKEFAETIVIIFLKLQLLQGSTS